MVHDIFINYNERRVAKRSYTKKRMIKHYQNSHSSDSFSDSNSSIDFKSKYKLEAPSNSMRHSLPSPSRFPHCPVSDLSQNQMPVIYSIPECSCTPRILAVDDTDFNILALRAMISSDFGLSIDAA